MIRALAHYQLADHPVLNCLARLPPLIRAGGLRADLKDSPARLHFLVDSTSFIDSVSHRLFKIDVFAFVHRLDRHARMPVIGSCDDDRVDVFAIEYFAIVHRAVALGGLFGLAQTFGVNITHGDDASRGGRLLARSHHPSKQIGAAAADANQGYVDVAVCASHVAQDHRRSTQDIDCRACANGRLNEVSAIQFGPHNSLSPGCESLEFKL